MHMSGHFVLLTLFSASTTCEEMLPFGAKVFRKVFFVSDSSRYFCLKPTSTSFCPQCGLIKVTKSLGGVVSTPTAQNVYFFCHPTEESSFACIFWPKTVIHSKESLKPGCTWSPTSIIYQWVTMNRFTLPPLCLGSLICVNEEFIEATSQGCGKIKWEDGPGTQEPCIVC